MLQKIRTYLAAAVVAGSMLLFAVPAIAAPNCNNPGSVQDQLQCGANGASGATNPDPSKANNSINGIITEIINILTIIVGIIAVIMIIVGGLQYITSGGSSEKVGKAKNAILYAIIGLVIVAIAQVIVRFVLNKTTSVT